MDPPRAPGLSNQSCSVACGLQVAEVVPQFRVACAPHQGCCSVPGSQIFMDRSTIRVQSILVAIGMVACTPNLHTTLMLHCLCSAAQSKSNPSEAIAAHILMTRRPQLKRLISFDDRRVLGLCGPAWHEVGNQVCALGAEGSTVRLSTECGRTPSANFEVSFGAKGLFKQPPPDHQKNAGG